MDLDSIEVTERSPVAVREIVANGGNAAGKS